MTNRLVPFSAFLTVVLFAYCSSTRNASVAKSAATVSFAGHVKPILENSCTPCHFNATGKRLYFGDIDSARKGIDDILRRVQLPTDHKDFMPFKMKKPPLTDTTITVLKRWKETGLME